MSRFPTGPRAIRAEASVCARILLSWCATIVAVTIAGCASATLIPMTGTVADLSALAGEWNGTYEARESARRGTMWLKLAGGANQANGEARMIPRGQSDSYGPDNPAKSPPRQPTQFLSISFIRVSSHDIDGRLDQYWDPNCQCFANTVFRGRLYGDELKGTFETRLANGAVASGRWRATRKNNR